MYVENCHYLVCYHKVEAVSMGGVSLKSYCRNLEPPITRTIFSRPQRVGGNGTPLYISRS